jgi:hypothetical protein
MQKTFLLLAAAALSLGVSAGPAAQADDAPNGWEIVPAPTDGPPFPAASVVSEDGYRLYLWSREDERGRQVFAELHAPDDARFIGRMPTWRIDEEPVVDADEIRAAGESMNMLWGFTGERVSVWMIWLGEGDVPADDPVHDWFSGETLAVTIRMANGEDRRIEFPLAGAGAAIEEAVEIRPVQTAAGG